MADYAEINNFPSELSSGGDKYFHLHNYSEYSEYTSGFFEFDDFYQIMTFFLKSQ
ncbi:hypothetical protein ECZC03_21130 [Escherichia coli]|nr:hypothetical protein ECZC03_21130 [Escherichia coli]